MPTIDLVVGGITDSMVAPMRVAVTGGSIGSTWSKVTVFAASRTTMCAWPGAGPSLAVLARLEVGRELESADGGTGGIGERLEEREAAAARAGALPPPEAGALEGEAEHRVDVVRGEGRDERAVGAVGLRERVHPWSSPPRCRPGGGRPGRPASPPEPGSCVQRRTHWRGRRLGPERRTERRRIAEPPMVPKQPPPWKPRERIIARTLPRLMRIMRRGLRSLDLGPLS